MIRPPTGDGFQDYSGVAQSPLADKQQSANVATLEATGCNGSICDRRR